MNVQSLQSASSSENGTFNRVNWTSSPYRDEDIDPCFLRFLSGFIYSLNRGMLRDLTKRFDMLPSQNPFNLLYHRCFIL